MPEKDENKATIVMVSPEFASQENGGKFGKIDYYDDLNNAVALDIEPRTLFALDTVLTLKPHALHQLELAKATANGADKAAVIHLKALLDTDTEESKKQALRFAYDDPTLKAALVVDLEEYMNLEMEKHEDTNRSRGR